MKWVTWDQAIVVAVITGALVIVLRRLPLTRVRSSIISACTEVALLSVLYAIWRLARVLPLDQPEGAIERARDINQLQQDLFFLSELSLQHFVLDHQWLAQAMNFYYAILHIPALVAFFDMAIYSPPRYVPTLAELFRDSHGGLSCHALHSRGAATFFT